MQQTCEPSNFNESHCRMCGGEVGVVTASTHNTPISCCSRGRGYLPGGVSSSIASWLAARRRIRTEEVTWRRGYLPGGGAATGGWRNSWGKSLW